MKESMNGEVALFVDAENLTEWLSRDGAEKLFSELAEYGAVIVRRAYGKWTSGGLMPFQGPLHRAGFELVHTYHPVKGKNSVDIQMTVDVMEYTSRVPSLHWYVLATGDSDFSPLFRRLRELGKGVIGVGPRGKLSEAVKSSCTRYIHTEAPDPGKGSASPDQDLDDALLTLKRAMESFPESVDIDCAALKSRMLNIDPAFNEKPLGYKQFTLFLSDSGVVSVRDSGNGIWLASLVEETSQPVEDDSQPMLERMRRSLRARKYRVPTICALEATLQILCEDDTWRTRAELIERLIEQAPDDIEGTDLRKAQVLLYRGHCFDVKKLSEGSQYRMRPGLTAGEGVREAQVALLRAAVPEGVAAESLEMADLQVILIGEVSVEEAEEIRQALLERLRD